MNQRTLIVFAVLLAATSVVYLVASGGPTVVPEDDVAEIRRGGPPSAATDPLRTDPLVRPETPTENEGGTQAPIRPETVGGGSVIGLRVPEGVDLSDPEQVYALLQKRLAAVPTDWSDVARLAALYPEPLDETTRQRLVNELVSGRRGLVLKVFQVAQDPTLVEDLLLRLDDVEVTGNARSAVLTALATLPRADVAEVVRGLEARLSGSARRDAVVLQAIGQRGGAEAARAITTYIAESEDPLAVAARGTLRLQLKDDPEATAVLATAIRETRSDEALGALIRIATQPGASGVVESLVALDSTNVSPEIRSAALRALAVIGTAEAVDHVLLSADGNDDAALTAIRSIGVMTAADTGARAKLLASLDEVPSGVHGDERRLETLRALSNLKHVPATNAFVTALDDRDERMRIVGAQGLGRVGEVAREHVDALVSVLASGSENLQRSVVIALGQIGGDEATGVLKQMQAREDLPTSLQRAVRMAVIRAAKGEGEDDREERLGGR